MKGMKIMKKELTTKDTKAGRGAGDSAAAGGGPGGRCTGHENKSAACVPGALLFS